MTTPTPPESVGETAAPAADAEAPLTGMWLVPTMILGLFGGLALACWLLLSKEQLETDIGKAITELLPFAVIWVGLIQATNQLLKATAAEAKEPHEVAQAAVYAAFLAKWNQLWPTLTTSVSVGYFTAVMAGQHTGALLSFVVLLMIGVIALAFASHKKVRSSLPPSTKDKANAALVTRPLLLLAYLIPVLVIVAFTQ